PLSLCSFPTRRSSDRSSGIEFDLAALGSVGALGKLALFLALFLVIRGAPALLLYRGALGLRDRGALAFCSATQLPLVVAITTLADRKSTRLNSSHVQI